MTGRSWASEHALAIGLIVVVGCTDSSQPADQADAAVVAVDARAGAACPEPEPAYGWPGDATDDARAGGRDTLFRRIDAPPFTAPSDLAAEGKASDGAALADLDGDGRTDILAVRNRPAGAAIWWYRNTGCLGFERKALTLEPPPTGRLDVPTVADLDGDGLLDLYVGSSGQDSARLYVARGRFDRFVDVAAAMGVQNRGAYNHGHAGVADLDGDGYLDLAVGANQIGNGQSGRALKRLYVYRPPASGPWEAGRFVDIATATELVPDFSRRGDQVVEADRCDPSLDRSGALVLLRDLDDDGDLDMLNGSSNDMFTGTLARPCGTGEWRFGVFAWNNLTAQGEPRFEPIEEAPGAIADHGQMRYVGVPPHGTYEVDALGRAFAPLSMNAADVDNDGDLDVLGLSPTDPSWHVQSDMIAARFWRNQGDWRFDIDTDGAGLSPLNWTYRQLTGFWDAPMPAQLDLVDQACAVSDWKPACEPMAPGDYQMMLGGGSIFADFNNDGWLDLHVVDRHDAPLDVIRNLVLMNRGDGTFELLTTEVSGIEGTGISADARDLDNDGLLDLVVLERGDFLQNDPAYPARDRIYWNTGALGGRDNHWVRIVLEGAPVAELIGAQLRLRPAGESTVLLGRRDVFPSAGTYKTSQDLDVHFGLGQHTEVDLEVRLYRPGASPVVRTFERIPVDRRLRVDVATGEVRPADP